jgi:hypothetical protein
MKTNVVQLYEYVLNSPMKCFLKEEIEKNKTCFLNGNLKKVMIHTETYTYTVLTIHVYAYKTMYVIIVYFTGQSGL